MTDLRDRIGSRVCVHLNLTRGDFVVTEPALKRDGSLKAKPSGSIHGYVGSVTLTDATFVVNETGRQYCVANNGRWVHAWIVGTLAAVDDNPDVTGQDRITYNPFRAPTFHYVNAERPIYHADRVTLTDRYGYVKETR